MLLWLFLLFNLKKKCTGHPEMVELTSLDRVRRASSRDAGFT